MTLSFAFRRRTPDLIPEHRVRTVQDATGVTWICLELPEVPADQQQAAKASPTEVVAIECNSGAERVIALVAPGWDDTMDDRRLTETIVAFLR